MGMEDHGVVRIPRNVYSLDAVLRACYWMTDRAYLHVRHADAEFIEVSVWPKDNGASGESLRGELSNTLIDHELRVRIAAETAGVRERLARLAFDGTTRDD